MRKTYFNQNGGRLYAADATAGHVRPGVKVDTTGYTVATAPTASDYPGEIIYVSNGSAGNPCLAWSNGSAWKVLGAVGTSIAAS